MAFKGVVFNEMKGAYSSPDNLLYRFSQEGLFPDTTYGVDSGGDPAVIPNLTYTQFKAFHTTYYHPSNALIFFSGDDDPAERLRFVDTYLREFDAQPIPAEIALQTPFSAPKTLVIPYDVGEDADPAAKKGMVTLNWLLTQASDAEQVLGLMILDHLLVGTPASPLRKALIDSGLGEDVTGAGLDDQLRQMYFSTGLKGIAHADAAKVEELILTISAQLAQAGFDADMLEAAVNTTEFSLRERNTGRYPRGLMYMFVALSTWLYGGDPFAPLAFEAPLQAIKARLARGERYFEELLTRYLVHNPHRVTVVLQPDPQVGEQQRAAETARLAEAKAALDAQAVQAVIDQTAALKRLQETPDSPAALATLPRLTLADIPRENKIIPIEVAREGQTEILYHDLFTNGIVYLDVGLNLHLLPQDLLPYAPFFAKALVKIGTTKEDFVKLTQRIGRKTGGIWTAFMNSTIPSAEQCAAWLFLRGKATVAQTAELLAILQDLLLTVKFDNPARFKQLVLERKAHQESALIPSGHQTVHTRLGARFDESGWLDEQIGGLSALFFTRQLIDEVERDWPAVLAKLEAIRRILLNRNSMICNVTVDRANWTQVQPQLTNWLRALPTAPVAPITWSPTPLPTHEGLFIPARVNYVGKGANLYALGYQYHGSVAVILNYLRTTWLWEKVRVQGGAYGGFCTFDRRSGVFAYLSYRDPNLLKTLDNYDQTPQFLLHAEVSADELTKNIIGVIGQLDDYLLPDAKGYTSMSRYLVGESDAFRQRIREQVLATQARDFTAFAETLQNMVARAGVVVMGSQEAIEQANAARGAWLSTLKAL